MCVVATREVRGNHVSIAFWSSDSDDFMPCNYVNSNDRKPKNGWRGDCLEEKSCYLLGFLCQQENGQEVSCQMKGQMMSFGLWLWIQSPGAACRPAKPGVCSKEGDSCGATRLSQEGPNEKPILHRQVKIWQQRVHAQRRQQTGSISREMGQAQCALRGGPDIPRWSEIMMTMKVAVVAAAVYACWYWSSSFITFPILQLRKQKLIQVLNDLPSQVDIASEQWSHDSH